MQQKQLVLQKKELIRLQQVYCVIQLQSYKTYKKECLSFSTTAVNYMNKALQQLPAQEQTKLWETIQNFDQRQNLMMGDIYDKWKHNEQY